jgi:hypothetical protein
MCQETERIGLNPALADKNSGFFLKEVEMLTLQISQQARRSIDTDKSR